jgi:hypothetical protein
MFPLFKTKPNPVQKNVSPETIGDVRVRVSLRARRMALRVESRSGEVVLVLPRGMSEKKAQAFVAVNKLWIDTHRQKIPEAQYFFTGNIISVQGEDYQIIHRSGRGVTGFEGSMLVVYGREEYLPRRLCDFLKKECARRVNLLAAEKCARLGLKSMPIRVIDPKSRWGSCAPDGRLMFSWRLILTPPEVLDYVVAHEVAHRIHMNHSRQFWHLCASLTGDATHARRWLKQQGTRIMAYR